jgi:hypothetical protein
MERTEKGSMATLSTLPLELKDHARQIPADTFRQLHQGEALHRLKHIHDALEAAASLPAEQYRHVTRRVKRELQAMPNAQYITEHKRLETFKKQCSQGRSA